jgi:hypothetical protein
MFIIGFSMVCCFYSIISDYLSTFIYKVFIYKVLIGFILGCFIKYLINWKFSMFRLDKGENNKIVNDISIFITVIVILLINIVTNVGIGFDLIPTVYYDEGDVIVTEGTNNNIEKDDKNYHFSISKKFVKEGFDSVLKVLSDSLPEIIGGFGGAKIGTAIIKGTGKLPPVQRAALGIVTGGLGAVAIGLGGTIVKNVRNFTESVSDDDLIVKVPRGSIEEIIKGETGKEEFVQKTARKLVEFDSTKNGGSGTEAGISTSTSKGTSTSISTSSGSGSGSGSERVTGSTSEIFNNAMDNLGGGDGGNFIPSLLDGNLSPLEIIINCEILVNIMILVHIVLLVLILIQKYNIKIIKQSSVGFIRKFLNKYKLNKVENFLNKLGDGGCLVRVNAIEKMNLNT